MLTYPAILDVPRELVEFLAAECRARGTRTGTRALTCWNQAVMALVWFREHHGRGADR